MLKIKQSHQNKNKKENMRKRRKIQFVTVAILSFLMLGLSLASATVTKVSTADMRGRIEGLPQDVHVDEASLQVQNLIHPEDKTSSASIDTYSGAINFIYNVTNPGDTISLSVDYVNESSATVCMTTLKADSVPENLRNIAHATVYFRNNIILTSGESRLPRQGFGPSLLYEPATQLGIIQSELCLGPAGSANDRANLRIDIGYDAAFQDHTQEIPLGSWFFDFKLLLTFQI